MSVALPGDGFPDRLEDAGDPDRLLRGAAGAWRVGYEDWGDTVWNEEGGRLTSREVRLAEKVCDGRVAGELLVGEG